MMKDETESIREATLDDLLIRWWNWKAPIQPARGHAYVSMGFEGHRTSRQYDFGIDSNEAGYAEEEAAIMRSVEREVNCLETAHRMVVYVVARSLTIGLAVFTSPRLTGTTEERKAAVAQARRAITERLLSAGVM